jgi:transposase
MREITTLGIDLAKNVFELHGVDGRGECQLRRMLRRGQLLAFMAQLPPCFVAMEACGGAHYWGREFQKLGHCVKLIAPQYVKPFVRGNKTNRNDAEAICEAGLRPRMPSVALKTAEQQAVLSLHRIRQLVDIQRKQLANQLRGLLAEFGIAIPKGMAKLQAALPEAIERIPGVLRPWVRETQERGVGPIIATAYVATIGDPVHYRNGRQASASLGLVPRQYSTGDEALLLSISKRGDRYLRTQLIHGARAVVRCAGSKHDPLSRWLQGLIARRGVNIASVALANKTARRLWAIWREQRPELTAAA